jgi:hypothetical protein
VLLDTGSAKTAHDYIRRASCCSHDYIEATVVAQTGEYFIEEFNVKCEAAIRELLGLVDPDIPLATILAMRPWQTADFAQARFYLIVQPGDGAADRLDLVAQAVREVRRRYEWLSIVLLTHHTEPGPADLGKWRLEDAIVVNVDEGDEVRGSAMTTRLMKISDEMVAR